MDARSGKNSGTKAKKSAPDITVGARVRVYPGRDEEQSGQVVEDFGPEAGVGVEIGDTRIASASRRWAVALDSGGLVFVDSTDIAVS